MNQVIFESRPAEQVKNGFTWDLPDYFLKDLYEAVRLNDPERLKSLLKSKKHQNDQEHMSMALHMAAQKGLVECGQALIDAGVSPDAHNAGGYTALILASRHGHVDFVKLLVHNNCNVHKTVYQTGASALHWAASGGKLNCARILIDAGCKVDATSLHGWTPLMVAASNDEVHIVNLLLSRGANPEARDIYKVTALHVAASEGAMSSLDELLSTGIDVNIRDKFGRTPVHHAVRHCHEALLSVLIQEKADVNSRDSQGLSPLHYSALYDNPACARELLDCGADVTAVVPKQCITREDVLLAKGTTAIMIACDQNADSVARIILEYKDAMSILEAKDDTNRTALQYACARGHVKCAEVLLNVGADPDRDSPEWDKSPLNLAISSKSLETVKQLIQSNCVIQETHILNSIYAETLDVSKILIMAHQRSISRDFLVSVSCDPSCIYQDNIYEFLSWAEQFVHARSLLHICRYHIRRFVGRDRTHLGRLPLPGPIIRYLKYHDLEVVTS